jgi:putative tryptophan/tyrosine transport system substrate-binding protein
VKRRDFIALIGGAAAAWPLAARAQQAGRSYRLGILAPSGPGAPPIVAFFDELRRSGFIEGQNLTVIPGGLGIRDDQNAEFAAALVKAAPDVIGDRPCHQRRESGRRRGTQRAGDTVVRLLSDPWHRP